MRCDICEFEYESVDPSTVASSLREVGSRFAPRLVGTDLEALRRRPSPGVWSALEYSCHVRDVLLVMRERVLLVMRDPAPVFTPMGRDERVAHDRYAEQDPVDVARQLTDGATMLAFVLEGLREEQWARTCTYNYPSPKRRSVAWLARHSQHEVEHHLADLDACLAMTSARTTAFPSDGPHA